MNLPKICNKPPRSVAGARRQYNAVVRVYRRAYAGGGQFGFDWPTFRVNWSEGYAVARRCADIIGGRVQP